MSQKKVVYSDLELIAIGSWMVQSPCGEKQSQTALPGPHQKRREQIVRKLRCSNCCSLFEPLVDLPASSMGASLCTLYILPVPSCLTWFSGCWPLPATILSVCLCSPSWRRSLSEDLTLTPHILYFSVSSFI